MSIRDEDLAAIRKEIADGHAIIEMSETLATKLLDEIDVLRAVVDAAADLSRRLSAHGGGRWDTLRAALKMAGR